MGVIVRLMRDSQQIIGDLPDPGGGTFDAAGDLDRLIPPRQPGSRLLHYIDPYGDAVFNHKQMPELLEDIADLATATDQLNDAERHGLDRLRVMAERCREGPHLYLWFLGD